ASMAAARSQDCRTPDCRTPDSSTPAAAAASVSFLGCQTGGKLGDVDDRAFVRALADFFLLVPGFHAKRNTPSIHLRHLRQKPDTHSHRRRGEMSHVDVRAHRIVARLQKW